MDNDTDHNALTEIDPGHGESSGNREKESEGFAGLLEPFADWLPGLFSFWLGGSEIAWVKAAWEVLGRRGLLNVNGEESTPAILDNAAVLITLSAINNRFQGIRNGENEGCAWAYQYPQIDQEDLGVSDLQVGRWAVGLDLGDDTDSEETLADLLKESAFMFSDEVYSALEDEWGATLLFGSLWQTCREDTVQPPDPDTVAALVNSPTQDMMATYSWFTNERDI